MGRSKLNEVRPDKYVREYVDEDGITSIWTYDWKKNHTSGVISVVQKYPPKYKHPGQGEREIPLSKQKFLNPKNGKMVGYQTAKRLKLI